MRTLTLLVGQPAFVIPAWWTRFTAGGWLFEQRPDGSIWYRDAKLSEMAPNAWVMAVGPSNLGGQA